MNVALGRCEGPRKGGPELRVLGFVRGGIENTTIFRTGKTGRKLPLT